MMSFSQAKEQANKGFPIRRECWDKDIAIHLQPQVEIINEKFDALASFSPQVKALIKKKRIGVMILPRFSILNLNTNIMATMDNYCPTVADQMANDWVVV